MKEPKRTRICKYSHKVWISIVIEGDECQLEVIRYEEDVTLHNGNFKEDEDTGEKIPSTTDRLDNHVAMTLIKTLERKAKFLGMDKPQEVKHEHKHTTIEDLVIQSKPLEIVDAEFKAEEDDDSMVEDVDPLTVDEYVGEDDDE